VSGSSEVNLKQSIALIEESIEFIIKPEYFQEFGNLRSSE